MAMPVGSGPGGMPVPGPGGMPPPGQFSIAKMVMEGRDYKGVRLPGSCTPEIMAGIESMDIREDDVILATYPKCGTHWMMEIIALIQHGGRSPSGTERLKYMAGLLEMPVPGPFGQGKALSELLPDRPSPRFMVTHLPVQFLPAQVWEKKPKVIYVSRDPRDCAASSYTFLSYDPQPPSFDQLFDAFISSKATSGSCWDHAHGFWEHRNEDNFFYVQFKDMKKDPAGCVAKVAAHLGVNLTEEQLSEVVKYSSLPEMKATYARIEQELGPPGRFLTHAAGILPFLHKGVVGGWKALFTVAQSEQFQKYHEEKLKQFGDGFSFE